MKKLILTYGKYCLIALGFIGLTAHAASTVAPAATTTPTLTTIPKTEVILDTGYHLTWKGGPFVMLCTEDKKRCAQVKIPKGVIS